MAKPKKRKKVKRRSKHQGADTSSKRRSGGGAMMGMRSGFKGVAGSLVGKRAQSKATQRFVDIFWWVVTLLVGAVAAVLLYNRYVR